MELHKIVFKAVQEIINSCDPVGLVESEAATTVYYDAIKLTGAAGGGGQSTTYAYDHQDGRVKLTEGSTTTFFPNKLYEQLGTTGATTNRTALSNSTASSTLGAASYQIATTAGSYSDTYDNNGNR